MPTILSYTNAFPNGPFPNHLPQTWSPTSLSNLVAFYRADIGVTQSSGNVSAWADQSGNGNTLTVTSGNPVWSSTGFNSSFPGVTFNNGSNTGLAITPFTFGGTTTMSAFFLGTMNTDIGANFRIFNLIVSGSDTAGGGWCFISRGSSTICFFANSGVIGTSTITVGTPFLFGCVANGTIAAPWLNGSPGTTSSFTSTLGSGTAANNQLATGYTATISNSWDGTLAAVILTSGVMSASDIYNLSTWANQTFGTSVGGAPHFVATPPQSYVWPGAVQPTKATLTVTSYTNAFPNGAFPQHLSGQTKTVQSFLFPGAVQPNTPAPTPPSNIVLLPSVPLVFM